ncbi:MAG: T9SS type A sorting domain-containing protein [Bacteroidota bacterium]
MRKAIFFASLLLLALASSLCLSQTGVRESFEYPLGHLVDSLGTAGNGWGSRWYSKPSMDDSTVVVADTGTQYNDLLNYPIHKTGHQAVGKVLRGWWGSSYYRYLAQKWPNTAGKTYWLSFAFDLKYNTKDCWAVISFWDSTKEFWGAPHGWGNDTVTINNMTVPRTPISTQDGPQWYVMRMDMKGPTDTTARVFLWVSPNPGGSAPDTAAAISKGTYKFAVHTYSSITGLDSLPVKIYDGFNCIHMEYSNSVDLVGEAMFDEIRLDTSWANVSGPIITGVDDRRGNAQPSEFKLVQNYPNPFNPTTQINYAVPQNGYMTLKVYNLLGQPVATLFEGVHSVGNYQATFNAGNLPSGVYFTRLQAGSVSITKKMLLMK